MFCTYSYRSRGIVVTDVYVKKLFIVYTTYESIMASHLVINTLTHFSRLYYDHDQ